MRRNPSLLSVACFGRTFRSHVSATRFCRTFLSYIPVAHSQRTCQSHVSVAHFCRTSPSRTRTGCLLLGSNNFQVKLPFAYLFCYLAPLQGVMSKFTFPVTRRSAQDAAPQVAAAAPKEVPRAPLLKDYVLRAGRLLKRTAAKSRAQQTASQSFCRHTAARSRKVQSAARRASRQRTLDSFSWNSSQDAASQRAASHASCADADGLPEQTHALTHSVSRSSVASLESQDFETDNDPQLLYLKSVAIDVSDRGRDLGCSPWVMPSDPQSDNAFQYSAPRLLHFAFKTNAFSICCTNIASFW